MLEDDGYYLPEIKAHSLEKIRRHNYYAALFSSAMSRKWPQRAYLGLYSGAGRARIAGSNEIVETTAMAVFRQDVPFTKYIFVDSDPHCIEALSARIEAFGGNHDVTMIPRPVNDAVGEIIAAMPEYSKEKGLLSLCFVDPFRVDLDFAVLKALSRFRMDFLVMLPLGYDMRRNLQRYLEDEEDDRIARLVDCEDWRDRWRATVARPRHFPRFALELFNDAMEGIGYHRVSMKDTAPVKVTGMGVYLYSLVLYSKHPLGADFWKITLEGTNPQLGLGI